jgi:hypothetical protein
MIISFTKRLLTNQTSQTKTVDSLCGTHGETESVSGTANCRGVRREGSEGVDGGVSRKNIRRLVGTRGQGVEETGVAIMGVEGTECGAGHRDSGVGGSAEGVGRREGSPRTESVLVICVKNYT